MSGFIGRKAKLKLAGGQIIGIRTKGLNWSGESVDFTTDDDEGIRLLDECSGQEQVDMPIDGILKDSKLLDHIQVDSEHILSSLMIEFEIIDPANSQPAVFFGDFRLSSFEVGMPYNDATTFSGTLESTGVWKYYSESGDSPIVRTFLI